MKILDMKPGETAFTQLGQYVLAVLSRREDGWCVYVGAVRGDHHKLEWSAVLHGGEKQNETVATAIVTSLFHPGFDRAGCPYIA